jgi:hypothetical protein
VVVVVVAVVVLECTKMVSVPAAVAEVLELVVVLGVLVERGITTKDIMQEMVREVVIQPLVVVVVQGVALTEPAKVVLEVLAVRMVQEVIMVGMALSILDTIILERSAH